MSRWHLLPPISGRKKEAVGFSGMLNIYYAARSRAAPGHVTLHYVTSYHVTSRHVPEDTVVPWIASSLQDEQKFLIHFNLIYERCLAIRVLCLPNSRDHKPLGLWVIVSHAQSQSAYLIVLFLSNVTRARPSLANTYVPNVTIICRQHKTHWLSVHSSALSTLCTTCSVLEN
jgi:hypothetical protein